MTAYVALLRAVNLGGSSTLRMADLKRLCEEAGFEKVRTYIASGNVLFESRLGKARVKAAIESHLQEFAGKPIPVFVRTADELAEIVGANPFPEEPASKVAAVFLDRALPKNALTGMTGQSDETVARGKREIYVCYPSGMGRSKLKIPGTEAGTARNMNTVARLAEMAAEI